LSSRYEGFPLALAEAMASGCAAVSYDCDTGPREIIEQGSNGLLVKAGNKQALAKALRALMTHDADRERMAARAASVGERFSVKRTGAMWHELFASLGGREEPRSAGAAARGASVHRP
jgi:glycosyltransferase involved in cell wall biosynthesis